MQWLKDVMGVIAGGLMVLLPMAWPTFACDMDKADWARDADFPAIASTLQAYAAKTGELPPSLLPLVTAQLITKVPIDPWGAPYIYEQHGRAGRIATLGRDGSPGGEDQDADIECWVVH